MVVKIDNVDAARPQSGINQADVVYEEEVEGGLTRLAAVFQSQYPAVVGPVRSGRLTDEGIADDLNHPVFAYSGTNAIFLPILRSQPVTDVDDDNHPGLFYRSNLNVAPHNLYANVASLAACVDHPHPARRPVPLPAAGGPPSPDRASPLTPRIVVNLSGGDCRRGTGAPPPAVAAGARTARPTWTGPGPS